jgi:LPS sulfotransferase NodH
MRNPIYRYDPTLWSKIRPSLFRLLSRFSVYDHSYTPFIVLTTPRSGSTLINHSLGRHPEVRTYGEVLSAFNPLCVDDDPVASVQRTFLPHPSHIGAVGCKLFYQRHINLTNTTFKDSPMEEVWTWLHRSRPDLKIIHLARENRLRAHVSWMLAVSSGQWVMNRSTGTQGPDDDRRKTITLDIEEWKFQMRRTQALRNEVLSHFADHDILHVTYTDLATDWGPTVQRIQSFLGVRVTSISQQTRKQNPEPLSKLIENYDQVRAALQGTEQEWMLDD